MQYNDFLKVLRLNSRVISVERVDGADAEMLKEPCSLAVLNRVMEGESVLVTDSNMRCSGARAGFGFSDEMPAIPGGFGNFISQGKGVGYPAGERIKRTPELAEQMMLSQPKNVMNNKTAIKLSPYSEGVDCDTVIALVNADQLSTLIHLFNFENASYDNVIVPMCSGCASVFRIPFGEWKKESPRAVVGGVDVCSRIYFPSDTFFFTVPNASFLRMIELSDENMLASPIFKSVKKRLEKAFPLDAEAVTAE